MASSPGWHEAPLFTQRAGKKPERASEWERCKCAYWAGRSERRTGRTNADSLSTC